MDAVQERRDVLDEPIARLEECGLSLRLINRLEVCFRAIYLRDLQRLRQRDLLDGNGFGANGVRQIVAALRAFLENWEV